MDAALVMYAVNSITAFIGVGLMSWWIYTLIEADKKPSFFYWIILIMFIGDVCASGINVYARTLGLHSPAAFYAMSKTYVWPLRYFPKVVGNGSAVALLLYRYFFVRKYPC